MVSGNTSARSTLPSGTLVHLPQPTPAPLAMLTAAVEVAKLGLGSLEERCRLPPQTTLKVGLVVENG